MRTFGSILKISVLEQLQYKASFISGVICQLAFGFMYIMLYQAFYANGVPQDFNASQMATYIWLVQAFYSLFAFFDMGKNDVSKPIMNGDVGYQLVKPINLYNFWYGKIIAKSMAMSMVRFAPIIVIGFILPAGFGMALPVSLPAFGLFLVSLILGILLVNALRMICHLITLYTLDSRGVFSISVAVVGLLAGHVIPIPLMPQSVQVVLSFLPFRYISDLPYRIYMGNIDLKTGLIQIGFQCLWIVGIVVVGKLLFYRKSKKLVVQGG